MELMPGYKQTEVGEIPDDWRVSELKALVLDMLQGVNTAIDIPEYVDSGSGIPMLKANNIIDQEVKFDGADHISRQTYAAYSERYKLKKNDFLFSNIGARLGTGSLLTVKIECSFAWNVMRIVPNTKKIIPSYLSSIVNSPKISQNIKDNQSGSGMGFVPKGVMEKIQIPLPSTLGEQTAIANALSDADALIQSFTRLIAKKRQIKQGAMQTLLNPYENGQLKAGRVVKKLGNVAELINGRAYSLLEWESHGIPVSRLQNLTGRGEQYYYSNLKLPEKQYCVFGDLLFMWSATFGPVIWKGEKAIYHYHIWKIDCNPSKVNKLYLYYILNDLTEHLKKSSSSGGTMLHVTKEKMESTEIIFPNIDEQNRIATILFDMDTEIAALETKLAKYRHIKQGMMQNLLTGRIRLVKPESNIGAVA